jgi:hypothetical protein
VAQPALGLIASAIVVAISMGFIALFDFPTFAGWVAFFNLCLIPAQIVAVVLWAANPPFVASLRQPAKGLALLVITIIAAAVIAPIALQLTGEGVSPPGPIPTHYVIIVVPTTFFLAIIFGGWPFTAMMKNSVAAGLALLVASYAITYVIFQLFFNYGFLQGAPVYLASAPAGMFNAVMAMVFYVTALAVMFLILCFDLWPLTTMPGVMKQPILGIVWMIIALAGAALAMQIGVVSMGTDPMVFLTRVTAPFIFGTIIVLNMLQNSLFAKMAQPLKGVMNAIAAAVIGVGLAMLYGALAPTLTGPLPSGPAGYEYEIWLANSLLSVTFPFLIFFAAYFNYWPMVKEAAKPETMKT